MSSQWLSVKNTAWSSRAPVSPLSFSLPSDPPGGDPKDWDRQSGREKDLIIINYETSA